MSWSAIPQQAKTDLLEWLNVAEPDAQDRQRLARLYAAGKFHAWNCPTCGERVYYGNPGDWDHFQGVRQVDHMSYPGYPEYFAPRTISQQCDSCRMHNPLPEVGSATELEGIGEPDLWEGDDP